MKRSEILKLIEGLYNLELEHYPKENPACVFAENLLCQLEENGMIPLGYIETYTNSNNKEYSREFIGKWEPEDET